MKKLLASCRRSQPLALASLLRCASNVLSLPRSSRSLRAGWTLVLLALIALAGSTRPARAEDLTVDAADDGNSPYTYDAARGTSTYGFIYVGYDSTGVLNQTGGTLNAYSLYLGYAQGSSGTYTLSAGSLSAAMAYVGFEGTSTFNQSGGTFTVTNGGALDLGGAAGVRGTYNLSGTGSLSTGGAAYLGTGGTGIFNQSGGTFTTNDNRLDLGEGAGSSGTYTLSNGSLSTGAVYVGDLGSGAFTQSGGSFTTNGNTLTLAYNSQAKNGVVNRSSGSYTLSGGSLSTGEAIVGNRGTATFTQSGGSFTTNGNTLSLANDYPASKGTYHLDGGTLTVGSVSRGNGTGVFNFNGGTLQAGGDSTAFFQGLTTANVRNGGATVDTQAHNVTIAQNLLHSTIAGDNATDGGLTKLGAGTLTLTGNNIYTGNTTIRAGTLAVTGGSVGGANSTATLTVDGSPGSPAAALTLSGTTTTLTVGQAQIGNAGAGTLTQSGGTHTVGGTLYVGYNAGATGTYNLSGGTITANESQLGNGGTGTFTQSGGTHATNTSLFLGLNNGSGTYNLSGGTLAPANYLSVGYSGSGSGVGTGVFNQSGGTVTTGTVFVGTLAGSTGTYNLDGGTLTATGVHGGSGTSTLTFNGGTLQASADNANFLGGLTTAQIRDGQTTFDTDGHNVTVSQSLSHAGLSGDQATDGGIAKRGAGTLTFTGNNTYTGNTRIYDGTFVNNGQLHSPASTVIYAGATLGGNGFQQGNLYVLTNATLAPSQAAGLPAARLTLGGTFSLASNALLSVNLAGAAPGSGYDQILVSGAVTLGGNLRVTLANGLTPTLDESFTLIDQTGTGTTTGTFANASGGLYTDAAGDTFLVNYAAVADGDLVPNDVTLTYLGVNVVPEPGTWACLLLGAAGLGLTLRLRRRTRF